MKIEHHNPESMYKSPVFSQGTSLVGPARIIYVGGQNGIDASGKMVGEDVESQTAQAVRNVLDVLKSAGRGHLTQMRRCQRSVFVGLK